MKFQIDGETVLELTDICKDIICSNYVNRDDFVETMKRRVKWAITKKKIVKNRVKLRQQWADSGKLAANGVTSIPTDPTALCELIFAQTDLSKPHVYRDQRYKDADNTVQLMTGVVQKEQANVATSQAAYDESQTQEDLDELNQKTELLTDYQATLDTAQAILDE